MQEQQLPEFSFGLPPTSLPHGKENLQLSARDKDGFNRDRHIPGLYDVTSSEGMDVNGVAPLVEALLEDVCSRPLDTDFAGARCLLPLPSNHNDLARQGMDVLPSSSFNSSVGTQIPSQLPWRVGREQLPAACSSVEVLSVLRTLSSADEEVGYRRWRGVTRARPYCASGRPPLPPAMAARRNAVSLDSAPSDLELSLLRISSGSTEAMQMRSPSPEGRERDRMGDGGSPTPMSLDIMGQVSPVRRSRALHEVRPSTMRADLRQPGEGKGCALAPNSPERWSASPEKRRRIPDVHLSRTFSAPQLGSRKRPSEQGASRPAKRTLTWEDVMLSRSRWA
eukprot:jgi/Botrbrau1/18534/Bobra.0596s0001.1